MNTQPAFHFNNEKQPKSDWLQLHAVIVDRGSKYSVTGGKVESEDRLKAFLACVKKDKKYQKATHNTYAARIVIGGRVVDFKNDDGETGAGMVILRQMKYANVVNCVVVVTRWFGGTKLFGDRFAHVQNATKEILNELM
ncbi:YigZ family protein [Patescibacteria group bacterium]|nr:YigZ family protein [Patescibacteria group bacterium]